MINALNDTVIPVSQIVAFAPRQNEISWEEFLLDSCIEIDLRFDRNGRIELDLHAHLNDESDTNDAMKYQIRLYHLARQRSLDYKLQLLRQRFHRQFSVDLDYSCYCSVFSVSYPKNKLRVKKVTPTTDNEHSTFFDSKGDRFGLLRGVGVEPRDDAVVTSEHDSSSSP